MTKFAVLFLAGVSAVSLASAVQAADLIVDEPMSAGVVSVAGDWDGAYIGAFVGAGWATAYDSDGDDLADSYPLTDFTGWLVGGTLGANFTVGNGVVLGVVADAAWTDINTQIDGGGDFDVGSIDWQASLRGRIGFDGGAFLPYLTGGLALAGGTITDPLDETDSASATHVGWTAGAGIEFMVSQDLSIDALYRYSDYGSADYDLDPDTVEGSFTSHTVQVGLNWHF